MDLFNAALPNIMLIVGAIAIGIGLGVEFKIVEVKGQLTRTSRIGAITAGIILIAASVFLHLRPTEPTSTQAAVSPTPQQGSTSESTAVVTALPVSANVGALPGATEVVAAAPTDATIPPTPSLPPTAVAVAAAPAADPVTQARQVLEAGIAAGQGGKEAKELLKKLNEVQGTLQNGNSKKAEEQMREIRQKIREGSREGKLDVALADQLLALLGG